MPRGGERLRFRERMYLCRRFAAHPVWGDLFPGAHAPANPGAHAPANPGSRAGLTYAAPPALAMQHIKNLEVTDG